MRDVASAPSPGSSEVPVPSSRAPAEALHDVEAPEHAGGPAAAEPDDTRAPDDAPEVTETSDGRSTRWADHRLARRSELVHAARRAVHRHGPDVSMDEIAATAGTSKPIVYRYFTDKTGLQLAVGQAVVAQMHTAMAEAAQVASTPREALRSMVDIYLEMSEASPNVYWFVTRALPDDASDRFGHFLDAVVEQIARPFTRVLTQDPSADVWAAGAVGFVRGVCEWWLHNRTEPGAPSREELTERVTAWLWTGPVGGLTRSVPGGQAQAQAGPAVPSPGGPAQVSPTEPAVPSPGGSVQVSPTVAPSGITEPADEESS